MNALGEDAIGMLATAVKEAHAHFDALVIGNQGEHFSAGANLMLMLLGTIGLGYVLDNLAVIIWGAEGFAVKNPLGNQPIVIGGVALLPWMLLLIAVSALLMVALNVFLARAKIGKAMRAAAQDRRR